MYVRLSTPLNMERRASPPVHHGSRHAQSDFGWRSALALRTGADKKPVLPHPGTLNGFSRKMENHAAAVSLNYFACNFIKIHRTLRVRPAMAAGVTDRLWSVEDLVALWKPTNNGGRKEWRN
jgi:hypothetical protein